MTSRTEIQDRAQQIAEYIARRLERPELTALITLALIECAAPPDDPIDEPPKDDQLLLYFVRRSDR